MKLTEDCLRRILESVADVRSDEICCGECYDHLDRFAELTLAGRSTAEAMPLIEDHMAKCGCCRTEFEALLAALRATAADTPTDPAPSDG